MQQMMQRTIEIRGSTVKEFFVRRNKFGMNCGAGDKMP
jgi:hypothetical protein